MLSIPAASHPVGHVTLYAGSAVAQCSRVVPLSLPDGKQTTIQIEGLPDGFERESLRVEGQGAAADGVSILDVVPRTLGQSELPKTDVSVKRDELQGRLDITRKQLELTYTRDNALARFLQEASPAHAHLNLAIFLDQVEAQSLKAHAERAVLQRDVDSLEQQLRDLGGSSACSVAGAVRVVLETARGEKEGATRALSLKLTYFVHGASWRPSYDVRSSAAVSPELSPLTINYKAVISNNTGEDWTRATLSLSTVSPNQSTTIPTLTAPELGFPLPPAPPPHPAPRGGAGGPMLYAAAAPMAMMRTAKASVVQLEEEADGFGARDAHVEGGAGRVGMVMRIDSPVDIASDGEQHTVSIARIVTLAKLTHIAVPTKSTSVFLRAEAKNASSYPLLAGPTNLYVAGSFSGKGRLPEVAPGGPLTVSLGVDPGVRVTCPPEVRFKRTSGGFVRKDTEVVSFWQKTTVENTHATPLSLTVLYAFPRSTDSKIAVRPSLPKGAAWDAADGGGAQADDGKARWEGVLPAGRKAGWQWEWDVEGSGWAVLGR